MIMAALTERRRVFDRFALAGTMLLYAVLAARHLDIPIPGYDEAIYVPPALDVFRAVQGGHPRHWPLMVMSYVGCPMSYLLAPFVGFWGINVYTMRLPAIGVALMAVLILLYLASTIFPRLPLWAPALLCLLNSGFLITSRTGLFVDVSIHWLLLSLTLLCLWNWSMTRRPLFAFLAFLCVGFGIYSKIIFVWFAFPAALIIEKLSRREGRAVRLRLVGLCVLGLSLGVLPLVIYNVQSGWKTAHMILDHLLHPAIPGTASNTSLLQNMATRWDHFLVLFKVAPPSGPMRRLAGAILLMLFFAGFLLFPKKRMARASIAGAGAFIVALVLGSTITITGRIPQHLNLILPLILVLSGVALARLIPERIPLLLACLLLLLPQLVDFNAYVKGMGNRTDYHSPHALASLSAYLSKAGIIHPMALDWGLSYPLFIASEGEIVPRDDWDDPPHLLMPGSVAICYWNPSSWHEDRQNSEGCDRLLNNHSFVFGEIHKIPEAPAATVYAVIPIRSVH
jgi:4-amino-4-deoxy-L-arabinose transferase-like glycosyltransferase